MCGLCDGPEWLGFAADWRVKNRMNEPPSSPLGPVRKPINQHDITEA